MIFVDPRSPTRDFEDVKHFGTELKGMWRSILPNLMCGDGVGYRFLFIYHSHCIIQCICVLTVFCVNDV